MAAMAASVWWRHSLPVEFGSKLRHQAVIILDFEHNAIEFHQIHNKRQIKDIFGVDDELQVSMPFPSSDGNDELVCISITASTTNGAQNGFTKLLTFSSSEHTNMFATVLKAMKECGSSTFSQFTPASVTSSLDYIQFLLASSTQDPIASLRQLAGTSSLNLPTENDSKDWRLSFTRSRSGNLFRNSSIDGSTFNLYFGESIQHQQENCTLYHHSSHTAEAHITNVGTFYVTNFRVVFRDYERSPVLNSDCEIPVAVIERMHVKQSTMIVVNCKDNRKMTFGFDKKNKRWVEGMMIHLNRLCFPGCQTHLFAYQYAMSTATTIDGWTLYNASSDFKRLGLLPHKDFRAVDNSAFEISPTYPPLFVVPSLMTHDDVLAVASFRSRARVVATTWKHHRTEATLSRCAQPLSGFMGKRQVEDEKHFELLRTCNPSNSEILYIVDARPYKAAVGNTVMGKGFENTDNYKQTKLLFMDIDNIHAIRESYQAITSCIREESLHQILDTDVKLPPTVVTDYLTKIESSKWLHYVRLVLLAAVRMVKMMDYEGASVIVHCSDGWDRTSQLTALAQLMMDPFYRSMEGFAILIEKEWLSFGHKMSERYGHAMGNADHDQRAPIFTQFLDCVHQLLHQFPCSFGFNERFLIEIHDQLLACRFGTFLFDSCAMRMANKQKESTVSLWSYLFQKDVREYFVNPFYNPTTICSSPISEAEPSRNSFMLSESGSSNGFSREYLVIPNTHPCRLVVWNGFFCRWRQDQENFGPMSSLTQNYNVHATALLDEANRLVTRHEQLIKGLLMTGIDPSTFIDEKEVVCKAGPIPPPKLPSAQDLADKKLRIDAWRPAASSETSKTRKPPPPSGPRPNTGASALTNSLKKQSAGGDPSPSLSPPPLPSGVKSKHNKDRRDSAPAPVWHNRLANMSPPTNTDVDLSSLAAVRESFSDLAVVDSPDDQKNDDLQLIHTRHSKNSNDVSPHSNSTSHSRPPPPLPPPSSRSSSASAPRSQPRPPPHSSSSSSSSLSLPSSSPSTSSSLSPSYSSSSSRDPLPSVSSVVQKFSKPSSSSPSSSSSSLLSPSSSSSLSTATTFRGKNTIVTIPRVSSVSSSSSMTLTSTVVCPMCGFEYGADCRFCSECGNRTASSSTCSSSSSSSVKPTTSTIASTPLHLSSSSSLSLPSTLSAYRSKSKETNKRESVVASRIAKFQSSTAQGTKSRSKPPPRRNPPPIP